MVCAIECRFYLSSQRPLEWRSSKKNMHFSFDSAILIWIIIPLRKTRYESLFLMLTHSYFFSPAPADGSFRRGRMGNISQRFCRKK